MNIEAKKIPCHLSEAKDLCTFLAAQKMHRSFVAKNATQDDIAGVGQAGSSWKFSLLHSVVCKEYFMRRLFLAILVLAFTLPAHAQDRHPFTFEDMMKLKRVGEPEVSPDGKWVIFSVVDVSLKANTKTPHVWIVPLAGGQEREIFADQDADRPRWAPDGKHFAFLSTKEGGSQVWIADFDGTAGNVTAVNRLTE